MIDLGKFYGRLLDRYGPQGWWPLLDCGGRKPAAAGRRAGYHPGEYDFPRSREQCFEICVGAILTQNTAWSNVEKALLALRQAEALRPRAMRDLAPGRLAELIRPSGYFNLKARKLREFTRFFENLGGRVPNRAQLLSVWGVGPETADSMLLYAYAQTTMVVDSYTRRVLAFFEPELATATYDQLKDRCEQGLPRELPVYQEFHALVVEHAKHGGGNPD